MMKLLQVQKNEDIVGNSIRKIISDLIKSDQWTENDDVKIGIYVQYIDKDKHKEDIQYLTTIQRQGNQINHKHGGRFSRITYVRDGALNRISTVIHQKYKGHLQSL